MTTEVPQFRIDTNPQVKILLHDFVIGQEIKFNFFGQSSAKGKFISMDENGVITYETIYDSLLGKEEIGKIGTAHKGHLVK